MELPPHVEFFIQNHRDIAAIIDLNKQVRKDVPDLISQELRKQIERDRVNWRDSDISDVMCDRDFYWFNQSYNKNKGVGIYFGLYKLWSLCDPDVDEKDQPILYLYYGGTVRGLSIAAAKETIRTAAQTPDGIRFHRYDEDDRYLAYQPLGDVANINALGNVSQMIRDITLRARLFTEALAPLLREFPKP